MSLTGFSFRAALKGFHALAKAIRELRSDEELISPERQSLDDELKDVNRTIRKLKPLAAISALRARGEV